MSVQDVAEHWLADIAGDDFFAQYVVRCLDYSERRHQCDVPRESIAGRMHALSLELFLLAVQSRMNADETVQCKKPDFYSFFSMVEGVLDDTRFDHRVAKSHVIKRALQVPPPPLSLQSQK